VLVNIVDLLVSFPFIFLVSEFVHFGDLHTFWQVKKKFDENTVRLLGAEIALALGNCCV
jgi:hypothetical protein